MQDAAGQLVLKWTRLNAGEDIDVVSDCTRLTLDTTGLCTMGYRFNSFYRESLHPFNMSLDRVLMALQQGGPGQPPLPVQVAYPSPQLREDLTAMNLLVDALIQQRRAAGQEADTKYDLLDYLLTEVDHHTGECVDDPAIRCQLMTFLIAGHETTSSLLSFAIYFLLKHPTVLTNAYNEVDQVLGCDFTVTPTLAQVYKLTYVSKILKESLRLWPPVVLMARHSHADTVVGGKYRIDRGDYLGILVPMLHRDTAVWGERAEEFDPEHFNLGAEQAQPANAFRPFGTGQRACIGRQFALLEAALALGMILQRFELIDHAHYQLHLQQGGTVTPDHFTLRVSPRIQRARHVSWPHTDAYRQRGETPSALPFGLHHDTPS
jgi:cytochrome P450/NADPH-cytochrome P450 reductase